MFSCWKPVALEVDGHRADRSRSDLVKAGAAIDRSIVARCERDDRLAPTRTADRRVKLARSVVRPGALGDRSARGASLWVVGQPLALEERLFPRGEDELLGAVSTGQGAVVIHRLSLLGSAAPVEHGPGSPSRQRGRVGRTRALSARVGQSRHS